METKHEVAIGSSTIAPSNEAELEADVTVTKAGTVKEIAKSLGEEECRVVMVTEPHPAQSKPEVATKLKNSLQSGVPRDRE